MRPLLLFMRRYGVRYLPWYLGGTLLIGATNWLSVTIPLYLATGIDAVALGADARSEVVSAAMWVAIMGLCVIVVRFGSRMLFFTPGRLVEAEVKRDLFHAVLSQQPAFHAQFPAGDLMSRMSSDISMVRLLFGFTALGIVNTIIAIALTASQMVRLSPTLAAAVTIPLVVGFTITLAFVGRFRQIVKRIQEANSALSDQVLSSYQGIATLKAFGAEQAIRDRFSPLNTEALQALLSRARLRVGIGPVLSLAASFNLFLLLWVGGPMVMEGALSVGELVAFTALVTYLTAPLRGMTFILSLFRQAQAAVDRIDAVILPQPHRPDLPNPEPAPAGAPVLELRDLSYRYPGASDDALHGVSVTVPAGGTLGVFGPTGSGKSTLLRCLVRLEDPPEQSVRADGVCVREIELEAWRRLAVLVPQRAFLFTESVKSNILLGDTHRDLDALLQQAQLDVDMAALPDGVHTEVGEAGLTLSGGQRQRVALARGLARRAGLLMLDDVLSAVDHTTEGRLIDALQQLDDRPTTVIVANRISALRHATVTVVLDGGRMVAKGTHEELVAMEGPYRDAWDRQSEGAK
ncbi:MAG: ABC transporter ATP-binding protein/permease [Myxococcales bacterium]|nr:ABC transporter ATP-binding protein/permease [Myxococcales bacterium]